MINLDFDNINFEEVAKETINVHCDAVSKPDYLFTKASKVGTDELAVLLSMMIIQLEDIKKKLDGPESIKQGEWIKGVYNDGKNWRCSECGTIFHYRYKHCPNCGLPMNIKKE